MRRLIIALLLVVFGFSAVMAQDVYTSSGRAGYHKKAKKKGYDPDRLIVGGGLAAGFGGGTVTLGVSPIVGYRITNIFSAGVGLGYEYDRFMTYTDAYNNSYYATNNMIYPSLWARCFVYKNIFLTSVFEYDFMHIQGTTIDNMGYLYAENEHLTAPCLLLGGGFKQPLGGRVSGIFEVLYDAIQNSNSPYYSTPVIRIGFVAGL